MPENADGTVARVSRSPWPLAVVVGVVALVAFGWDLASEPFFADESAYYSQSYFVSTFASGRFNDPAWLDYAAYDLPPLPKYLIGAALWVGGYETPGPAEAWVWYHVNTLSRFDPPGALATARVPMVIVGAFGCVAVYGIGVLVGGRAVGGLAAALLIANPLYRLHAHRAMSDVPCESFMLLALFFGLVAWHRQLSGRSRLAALSTVVAGLCAGLAVLSKLSGLLALMVLAAWVVLAFAAKSSAARKAGVAALALVSAATAFAVFVSLDPFLTAHPTVALSPSLSAVNRLSFRERALMMFRLRSRVSADQKIGFAHNALHTPMEKIAVSVVQGFGRFGPFGPTHSNSEERFEWKQDWGAVVWLPWVLAGAGWAAYRGGSERKAGDPPVSWAVLVQFCVAFAVVTLYLPMAWDRYLLPIQAPAALLASGVAVAAAGRIAGLSRARRGGGWVIRVCRRPEVGVFLVLFGSYSYFWQARDWNCASRLMLTYALVDRGTIAIDGLEDHTHDRARFRGHYYTDKFPGFSLVAAVPYVLSKVVLRIPPHPLNIRGAGFPYWPADYWVTLGTSGLFTALTGVVLVRLARDLGCGPRRAALVALAYGLATPAHVYSTMSYGYPMSSFALLVSFALLWHCDGSGRPALRAGLAGFLAAYAAVIDLQVGLVSAVLGLYLIAQVIAGRRKPSTLGEFGVGALVPTLILLGYNQFAFGWPFDLGYFHLTTGEFARFHTEANPLGLRRPGPALALALLWGRYRGLLFYAPIVALVPFGLFALLARRAWGVAGVSAAAMAVVFAVNVSYPAWTGGWSTGPRLLLPLLPFAMLPVAGLLARGVKWETGVAVLLTVAGGVLMLLFVAVGGRIPQYIGDPLVQVVWPLWRGDPVPGWDEPFTRNLAGLFAPGLVRRLPRFARGLQFAPLVVAQGVAIALMMRRPASEDVKLAC